MMEAFDNEQYVSFPMAELQEVQEDTKNVNQEEVFKPVVECIVPGDLEKSAGEDIKNAQIIQICKDSYKIKVPNEVKPNKEHSTSGDDESMAVEALRQLGGMYPRINEKNSTCPNCTTVVALSEMENHKKNCKVGKFICSVCGDEFSKKSDYNNHTVCHQVDRPHACRICGNLFRNKTNLQSHMTETHRMKVYKCNICGVDFQRPSSLSNHMKIHTYVAGRAIAQLQNEPKISVVNSSASTSVVAAIQDYDSVQWSMPVYSFSSDQSTVTIEDSDDKLNTLQEFTVIPNGEVTQFAYSTQNTGTEPQFVTISTIEDSEKVESLKKVISPKECEYCDKQFQDGNHLATHQKTCMKRLAQTGGAEQSGNFGRHACSECGKKFMTKQKMFRHQWIHRKKTHCCEICGTQFERQVELDEHRLSAHPGDSPFTCTECGKSFVSRQGLWEHWRTHAGSPAHFHCDKCSKTFTSRQGYLIHHRTHTGERPYGCKFCWKAFRDGGTLRKHERIHTGERPHVCPLCSRAFNQKVVLREHVRWVHAAAKQKSDSSEPPFPCPICGEPSQDRDELCAHIVKHSDKMIAEAKAKSTGETKKCAKSSKKKSKDASKTTMGKNLEEHDGVLNMDSEPVLLTVTEPLDKTVANQNVFIDSKQNTYILVNSGKSSKVHFVSELKQATELGRVKSGAIQICIEESGLENVDDENDSQKGNTLRLISKHNIDGPLLAIAGAQTNENFSSQIQFVADDDDNEYTEQDEMEIVHLTGVVDGVTYEIVDNEVNEIIQECRVCGEVGFKDKRELMDHVKTHM